jgi:cyclopropane fatty-acyl-phospholipid synthase-like methyltransferase
MKTDCCRVCHGTDLVEVMDFGEMALAGGFLAPGEEAGERRYPLSLSFCPDCTTLQVGQHIDRETVFGRYAYRTSASRAMRAHFEALACELAVVYAPTRVVEIGCNDGAMLRPLADMGVEVIGVDPSEAGDGVTCAKVVKRYFDASVAAEIGSADLVIACNVFAHVEDVHGFAAGVADMIGDHGVFVFETHYAGDMVRTCQYDAIYHEHVFYWTLMSVEHLLAMHGLRVIDVQQVNTHGGSMRYHVSRNGTRPASANVERLRMKERSRLLDWSGTYAKFATRAEDHRARLKATIDALRRDGAVVAGYGASGRANTMLQWGGIGLDYIVDDSPRRQGTLTPGTHIPVLPPAAMRDNPPDWLLVTAWTFMEEISGRIAGYRGGIVMPFPDVRLFPAMGRAA